jgi:hypothetical protein
MQADRSTVPAAIAAASHDRAVPRGAVARGYPGRGCREFTLRSCARQRAFSQIGLQWEQHPGKGVAAARAPRLHPPPRPGSPTSIPYGLAPVDNRTDDRASFSCGLVPITAWGTQSGLILPVRRKYHSSCSESPFQGLDEPVLCVAPSVERRDLLESAALIESARLHQIVSGIELKAGDPPLAGNRLKFIQKPQPKTPVPLARKTFRAFDSNVTLSTFHPSVLGCQPPGLNHSCVLYQATLPCSR